MATKPKDQGYKAAQSMMAQMMTKKVAPKQQQKEQTNKGAKRR